MFRRFLIFSFFILPLSILAQDLCGFIVPLKKGHSWEMSTFDAYETLVSRSVYNIDSVMIMGPITTAKVSVHEYDDSDRPVCNFNYYIKCNSKLAIIDMRSILPEFGFSEMMGDKTLDYETTSQDMHLPSDMHFGVGLRKCHLQANFYEDGKMMSNAKIGFLESKVESMEFVNTPVGNFIGMKVISNVEFEYTLGKAVTRMPHIRIAYYAKGVGLVKSMLYDNEEVLQSYVLITRCNFR